jgi:hypothetical protein
MNASNRVADLVRDEMSVLGLEVAAEGTSTIQIKTPNIVHDIGSIVARLESVCADAVVDVVVTGGELELLVSWARRRGNSWNAVRVLFGFFVIVAICLYVYKLRL